MLYHIQQARFDSERILCALHPDHNRCIAYSVYGTLLRSTDVNAWQTCFLFGACLTLTMFVISFALVRSSAASLGFRRPTQPSPKQGKARGVQMQHPMANLSSREMLKAFLGSHRSWLLLISMALLVCLKGSTSFITVYASDTLNATNVQPPHTCILIRFISSCACADRNARFSCHSPTVTSFCSSTHLAGAVTADATIRPSKPRVWTRYLSWLPRVHLSRVLTITMHLRRLPTLVPPTPRPFRRHSPTLALPLLRSPI